MAAGVFIFAYCFYCERPRPGRIQAPPLTPAVLDAALCVWPAGHRRPGLQNDSSGAAGSGASRGG